MNFNKTTINNCECHECDDFLIVKQKAKPVYNAYKAASRDDDGNAKGFASIEKVTLESGEVIAKEYNTLEEAKAACV